MEHRTNSLMGTGLPTLMAAVEGMLNSGGQMYGTRKLRPKKKRSKKEKNKRKMVRGSKRKNRSR